MNIPANSSKVKAWWWWGLDGTDRELPWWLRQVSGLLLAVCTLSVFFRSACSLDVHSLMGRSWLRKLAMNPSWSPWLALWLPWWPWLQVPPSPTTLTVGVATLRRGLSLLLSTASSDPLISPSNNIEINFYIITKLDIIIVIITLLIFLNLRTLLL